MFKHKEAQRYREKMAALKRVPDPAPAPPDDETVGKLRALSDRFGVNSVARLVQLAHSQGMGGKIKGLYRMAEKALSTKPDEQVLRPPIVSGGAVASGGPGQRMQIDTANMTSFGGDYSNFLIGVDVFPA